MSAVQYILESLVCCALFLALYKLVLEGRVSHRASCLYLVLTTALGVTIPIMELPLYPAETVYLEIPVVAAPEQSAVAVTAPDMPQSIDWSKLFGSVALVIYLVIAGFNLIRFSWRIYEIQHLRKQSRLTFYEAYTLAESMQVREPFSFWRTIFLKFSIQGIEREQIVAHEASHIRHHHTTERIIVEFVRCVVWFNPFVWIMGNMLIQVQEWEADSDVLSEGYDVQEYRKIIFRQLFGYNPDITCGLRSQITKKRFIMMTEFKKGKFSFLRLSMVLPMVAAMILAFGAVRAEAEVVLPQQSEDSQVDENKAEVYMSADGKLLFNGREVKKEQLLAELQQAREKMGVAAILSIKADDDVPMGKINEIKEMARAANMLRVQYDVPKKLLKGLLSSSTNSAAEVISVTDYIMTSRNLLTLFVNARGKVLTTRPDGTQGVVEMGELKEIVKAFVDNSEHRDGKRQIKNPNYADFTWQTIPRDKGEVHYPVSNGVISIEAVKDVPAGRYMEIQNTILEAYAELREELAQRSFHCSFASLKDNEKEYIVRAIPIRVSEVDRAKRPAAPQNM